jgi:hypothetical protein
MWPQDEMFSEIMYVIGFFGSLILLFWLLFSVILPPAFRKWVNWFCIVLLVTYSIVLVPIIFPNAEMLSHFAAQIVVQTTIALAFVNGGAIWFIIIRAVVRFWRQPRQQ